MFHNEVHKHEGMCSVLVHCAWCCLLTFLSDIVCNSGAFRDTFIENIIRNEMGGWEAIKSSAKMPQWVDQNWVRIGQHQPYSGSVWYRTRTGPILAHLHIDLSCWRVHLTLCFNQNEYEDLSQYSPCAIPIEIMPCYNYAANLLIIHYILWHKTVLQLSCKLVIRTNFLLSINELIVLIMAVKSMKGQVNLAHMQYHPIYCHVTAKWINNKFLCLVPRMSLMNIKIQVNVAHMQCHPRNCHATTILQVQRIRTQSLFSYSVYKLIWCI